MPTNILLTTKSRIRYRTALYSTSEKFRGSVASQVNSSQFLKLSNLRVSSHVSLKFFWLKNMLLINYTDLGNMW